MRIARFLLTVACFIVETPSAVGVPVDGCVLKCKDAHMYQLGKLLGDSSEWSMEFLLPLQSILRRSGNAKAATRQLSKACGLNGGYKECLRPCPKTMSKVFLELGMEPWTHICSIFDSGRLAKIIPCWRAKIGEIQSECSLEPMQKAMQGITKSLSDRETTRKRFGDLCGSIRDYDSCHLRELTKYCSSNARRFLMGLNEVTNNTLHTLLKYSSISESIPESCGLAYPDQTQHHFYEEKRSMNHQEEWNQETAQEPTSGTSRLFLHIPPLFQLFLLFSYLHGNQHLIRIIFS